LTFNGLYGVISQKTELFITTDVSTSNPTFHYELVNFLYSSLSSPLHGLDESPVPGSTIITFTTFLIYFEAYQYEKDVQIQLSDGGCHISAFCIL
jgi:hypothetical protein